MGNSYADVWSAQEDFSLECRAGVGNTEAQRGVIDCYHIEVSLEGSHLSYLKGKKWKIVWPKYKNTKLDCEVHLV